MSPLRLTLKLKGVDPLLPSFWFREKVEKARIASSLRIRPVAEEADGSTLAPSGVLRVTVKPSLSSTPVSPATSIVIVFVVSNGANCTLPKGKSPTVKSATVAAEGPLPLTVQLALLAALVSPLRTTLNVNIVLPLLPSGLSALVAVMASVGRGLTVMLTVAAALRAAPSVMM